jgi:acetoacetyl-CoA synthetase
MKFKKFTLSSEIQVNSLGMKVEIFDDDGRNIEHTGEAGELVCTRPHPSLPIKFWGDDVQHSKYMAAYYSTYPGAPHYIPHTFTYVC